MVELELDRRWLTGIGSQALGCMSVCLPVVRLLSQEGRVLGGRRGDKGGPRVPAPLPLSPFSPPDRDRILDMCPGSAGESWHPGGGHPGGCGPVAAGGWGWQPPMCRGAAGWRQTLGPSAGLGGGVAAQ